MLALAVISAYVLILPTPVHAAAGKIEIGDRSSNTITAISPSVTLPVVVTSENLSYGETVYVQKKTGGLWADYSNTYIDVPTGSSEASGIIEIFKNKAIIEAGTHTFRVVAQVTKDEFLQSPEFNITVNKVKTEFAIGQTAHVGKYNATYYSYFNDEIWYQVEKSVSVTWPAWHSGNVALQRLDGTKWVTVHSSGSYTYESSPSWQLTYTIKQTTPTVKQYRLYVEGDAYTTGGTSAIFKISGTKQDPKFTVKYSKTSQKYKKTAVKLTFKTKNPISGKATIYDGKKKLKTVNIKQGAGTYTLSKKLKKGTHKIKVKFVASGENKEYFKDKTTAVKKIKVK
jgi:hypothetical protein